ncbi:MAG: hypothetical protein GF368_03340, partial [Candidatus Aenigmarchaeota archaeon]|nr:hypothetical protein [Candidatus Aenigmarchaeota archaeon]
ESLENLKVDQYVDSYISFLTTKRKKPSELVKIRKFIVLTLPAGFTLKKYGWEDEMLEGIKDIIGDHIPIVGGSAGDDGRFIKNYQFANGEVYDDSVVLATIFSNVKFGFGLAHGFEPTEKIALVTKSKDNIVYELNGKPAVEVYAKMLGVSKEELLRGVGFLKMGEKIPTLALTFLEKIGVDKQEFMKKVPLYQFMMENPFGIPDVSGNYWIKNPRGIVDKKYIEFQCKIPKNLPLTLMKVDKQKSITATNRSLKESLKEFKKYPVLSIIFECGGRYFYLGEDIAKSLEKVRGTLDGGEFIGFYTSAEQGLTKNMTSKPHAYTCVSLSLSDELITNK